MEDIEEAWLSLFNLKLSQLLPFLSGKAPTLICSNNTACGELLFPKKVTDCILRSEVISLADLNKSIDDQSYPERYFSEFTLNQKHLLFVHLNHLFIYTKYIHRVINAKENYGRQTETNAERGGKFTLVYANSNMADMSVSEVRSLLTLGLLKNVLLWNGESVNVYLPHDFSISQLASPVGKLLSSFFPTTSKERVSLPISHNEFLAAFLPPNDVSDTHIVTSDPPHTVAGGDTLYRNMKVDIQTFITEHQLTGKGGYEKNIQSIQVTEGSGQLSLVATLAHDLCTRCTPGHVMIHVTTQRLSVQAQQVMILTQMFNSRSKSSSLEQHIALTSATDVLLPLSTNYPIVDLFRVRQEQMTSAFSARLSDTQKGEQLQELARRVAEGVVKFELLSHDPTSYVKIDGSSVSHDDDVRFDGAFVLYNYARLATLLNRHQAASEKGEYPPLPRVETVDFNLLKEEEEWQLMFHYVLQYPVLVKEAAKLTKKGVGVHITLGLKKVCQFLTRFSHAFSSYYSRTKVLMSPEPHLLPLIHARLYLMMAIKQVLHNGLTLLAIEPLEQL